LKEKLVELKTASAEKEPTWLEKKKLIPNTRDVKPVDFKVGHTGKISSYWFRDAEWWHHEDHSSPTSWLNIPAQLENDEDLRPESSRHIEAEYSPLYWVVWRTRFSEKPLWSRVEELDFSFKKTDMKLVSIELASQLLSDKVINSVDTPDTVLARMLQSSKMASVKVRLDKFSALEGPSIALDTFDYCWAKYLSMVEDRIQDFRFPPLPQNSMSRMDTGYRTSRFLPLILLLAVVGCRKYGMMNPNKLRVLLGLVSGAMLKVWFGLNRISTIPYLR
jgi:hypothetical protein